MGLIKRQAGVEVDFDKKAREFCDRFYIMKNCTQICEQGRLYIHKYGPSVFEVLVKHYYNCNLFNCDAFNWIALDFSLYKECGIGIVMPDFDAMGITPHGFVNTLNELDEHIINLDKVDVYIKSTKSKSDILKYVRIGDGDWKLEQIHIWD